jgi:hypothetical protein
MAVKTGGRTDVDDYFRLSGVLRLGTLSHTPFQVFVEAENDVEVHIIDGVKKLLAFSDETKVMGQWSGQWRSDSFQFRVPK